MELIHPLVQLDYRSIHWWAIGDHGWCVHHLNTCPSWSPFTAECCWLHYCCWWHTFPTHLALSPCLLGCLSLSFSRFYYSAHYTVYLLPHFACVFVALSLFAASYVLNITNANRLDYGMPLLIEYKSYKWTSKIYNFLAVLFFYRNFSVSNINALWLFALLWYSCYLISIVFSLLCTYSKPFHIVHPSEHKSQIDRLRQQIRIRWRKQFSVASLPKGLTIIMTLHYFATRSHGNTFVQHVHRAKWLPIQTRYPHSRQTHSFDSLIHSGLLVSIFFCCCSPVFLLVADVFFLRWRSLRFLFRYE